MVQYRAVILVLVCIFAGGVRAGAQTPLDLSGASPEVRAQLFQKARAMFMPDGLDQVHTHRVLGQAICGTPVVAAL
ncbi:MAG: hypothetical protein O2954_12780, partial [bacterium]|nr:hypothetical protein [bacterium]